MQRKRHRRSCAQFVLTVLLMFNFLVLVWVHEDIEHVYKLEHAVEKALTKSKFGPHSQVSRQVRAKIEAVVPRAPSASACVWHSRSGGHPSDILRGSDGA